MLLALSASSASPTRSWSPFSTCSKWALGSPLSSTVSPPSIPAKKPPSFLPSFLFAFLPAPRPSERATGGCTKFDCLRIPPPLHCPSALISGNGPPPLFSILPFFGVDYTFLSLPHKVRTSGKSWKGAKKILQISQKICRKICSKEEVMTLEIILSFGSQ